MCAIIETDKFKIANDVAKDVTKEMFINSIKETNLKYNYRFRNYIPSINWNPVFYKPYEIFETDLKVKEFNRTTKEWIYWEDKNEFEVLDLYIENIIKYDNKSVCTYLFAIKDGNQLSIFNFRAKTYKTFFIKNYEEFFIKAHMNISEVNDHTIECDFYWDKGYNLNQYFKEYILPEISESKKEADLLASYIINKYKYIRDTTSLEEYFHLN